LEKVLHDQKLDFCVLFSSNASILGGLGSIAYSAANIFMDSFAQSRNRISDTPWISINWDGWLLAEEGSVFSSIQTGMDQYGMTPEQSVEAFRRAVTAATVAQIVVSTGDLPTRLDTWIRRRILTGKAKEQARAPALYPRPVLGSSYVAPRNEPERKIVDIYQRLLGIEQVGITDNFFELGGHSLLATKLVSQLRELFLVELPLRAVFEAPTVAELASRTEVAQGNTRGLPAPAIVPAPRDADVPLSFAQQRLWFLDQLKPNDPAFNIPIAVRMIGRLNLGPLVQSINEIVRRHESLRTSFAALNGRPVQMIAGSRPLNLPIGDLKTLPEARKLGIDLAVMDAHRSISLTAESLLQVKLLCLSEREYLLSLKMHHIISDGWTIGVLLRELEALYNAFSNGEPSPLPEPPIQYADFAVWQRNCIHSGLLESQLAYWRQQLSHLPMTELPGDRGRPPVRSYRGQSQSFLLTKLLTEDLNNLSRAEGCTLFMTLLGVFFVLLQRYTGKDDVVVGTDIANRNRAEIEGAIGFFVNHLVLRADLSGDPVFRKFLGRARELVLDAYANQDLPFDKLVQELEPERSASQTPLFQTLLVIQNAFTPELNLTGVESSYLEIEDRTSKYDLAIIMRETSDGLVATWRYNTDIFDRETISAMAGRFETLLGSVVSHPDACLSKLEMRTEVERRKQAKERLEYEESVAKDLRIARRKTISLSSEMLVSTGYLTHTEQLPLVIQPAVEDVDLIGWAGDNREFIEAELLKHGAILFRDFQVTSALEFEKVAEAVCRELFGDYGDLPREELGGQVYSSTPYPADQAILFHNESSHMHRWPLKQWFYCAQAPRQGGETPLADCRRVYQLLDPQIRNVLAEKGLLYVRNFSEGLDIGWREFFHATDRAEVEDFCRAAGFDFKWKAGDGLRIQRVQPAVARHPKTGEMVFFNQIQAHHVSCLESGVKKSLLSIFGEEDLPRNVYYGDGAPIETSVINEVRSCYERIAVNFPWHEGDVLLLDNMLTAHGRNPYLGPRKIMVAMGDTIYHSDRDLLSVTESRTN
jgi:alpha-ketoglutarate-dependent taurine dioxygenase/acyl carrier protein